ncbi:MAG: amidophosphoribosyltransferase [Candidatus Omnitrophota bacterium]|nr:MAG: amidophosphoribosyltransferase [Candidatus Omnitrophota bacterium]
MSGIFGAISKKNCVEDLFYLGDYHSHLGTQFGGIAVYGKEMVRRIHNISYSQFKSKLFDDCKTLKGNKGIGAISYEEQPVYVKSKFGNFCIVTDGWIDNWKELARELFSKGFSFSEMSNSKINICELVSKLIIQKSSLVEGIEYLYSRIDGSVSLIILNDEGIYASRDKLGISPLVIGRKENTWTVVTETTSFPNLGFEVVKYLLPGEVVFIDAKGLKEKQRGRKCTKICAFLWIYTGFPASSYEGVNVEMVREHCGQFLARGDNIKPDMVSGVPDSGVAHALGYAMQKKVAYRRPLVKYTPGYGRSYLPASQDVRDLVARMKLIPIRPIIEGRKIVLCEDSIVRGTQLKNFTIQKLWENKAKEIHLRVASPPLMFPCKFNFSTRTKKELAARRAMRDLEKKNTENISEYIDDTSAKYKRMVSWITKDLGATSLKYQKLDDMVKAIGLPKEKLCLYCWTGRL